MGYTHLEAGRLFEITAYEHFQSGKEGFAELVKLPPEQLEELKKASAAKEKEIFGRICASTGEWHEQAQQTQQYQKAQEYARMLPVKHTGNQMQKGEYDWYEISNIVYRLTWREYEQTRYDRGLQKSVTCAWELSWYLNYNTPRNPDDTSGGRIAGQERKHFSDHAALEKYLQGRIKAYAHLFTELSPPIPEEHQKRFCVNGLLLPGYTVEEHRPTPQELLDFLEEQDIPQQQEAAKDEQVKKLKEKRKAGMAR